MLIYDNDPDSSFHLQRGAEALRNAIFEYTASLAVVPRRIFKLWRCTKCHAEGEVHSSCGETMVEAIRKQHKQKRLLAACEFDQDSITIRPIQVVLAPVPQPTPQLAMSAS